MPEMMTDTLMSEYDTMMALLGESPNDDQIAAELVSNHDWTVEGARTVLMLSRTYGSAILRNALVLAIAMQIEDGSSEL